MRYEGVNTLSFTDHNGKTVSIKARREYPEYQKLDHIVTDKETMIDEVASRTNVYGDGGEDQSYKIVDYNILELFEKEFNMSKIKRLDIPL